MRGQQKRSSTFAETLAKYVLKNEILHKEKILEKMQLKTRGR